jgi:hypothetical protein
MNLTEAYANEALTMVEELESVDCSTCEHKIIMSQAVRKRMKAKQTKEDREASRLIYIRKEKKKDGESRS